MSLVPSSAAGAKAPAGGDAPPNPTDQTSGELHRFIVEMSKEAPDTVGTMPVESYLAALKVKHASLLQSLGELFTAAREAARLDDATAVEWKAKGNHAFSARHFGESAALFTQAMTCARSDGVLATLVNNRSAAFFELQRYRESLIDAYHALRLQPDYVKAQQRAARCLSKLGVLPEGAPGIPGDTAQLVAAVETTIESFLGDHQLRSTPPPCARVHSALRVASDTRGRKIVAGERVDAGEQALLESPYAVTACNEVLGATCALCLRHVTALYPGREYREACTKSRGLFCGEPCAAQSWRLYGSRESAHPFFLLCPPDTLLAARIMSSSFTALDAATSMPADFDHTPDRRGFGAAHMDSLVSGCTRELSPQASVGGMESAAAALALFAGVVTPAEAEQLRRVQRQILMNAVPVTCVAAVAASPSSAEQSAKTPYGFSQQYATIHSGKAVYAIGSLFNHACDPNCHLSFVGNPRSSSAKLSVRTLRPIARGEELTVSYARISVFHQTSSISRQKALYANYGFVCGCEACAAAVNEVVRESEKEHYLKASDYYQKGRRLTREGNYDAAVTVLLQSYDMVMRYICPPPRPPMAMVPKTHNALAHAYYCAGHVAKCVEHLRAELALLIQLYGDNCPELVKAYARLVPLDEPQAAEHARRAETILRRYYAASVELDAEVTCIKSPLLLAQLREK